MVCNSELLVVPSASLVYLETNLLLGPPLMWSFISLSNSNSRPGNHISCPTCQLSHAWLINVIAKYNWYVHFFGRISVILCVQLCSCGETISILILTLKMFYAYFKHGGWRWSRGRYVWSFRRNCSIQEILWWW